MPDIAARRLCAHRLTGEPLGSAPEGVRWFGAVQSQDYGGAKRAVGQRLGDATDAELDRLFDAGAILRTHVMRPTWHFVLPEDVRWLLDLTAPRVRAGLAGRYRRLELDELTLGHAVDAFEAALVGGRHLTRTELGAVLERARISPDGQRLPHLLMAAELAGVIVSGPRHGKLHTYALLEERVPRAPRLEREAALAELAHRYFQSHGPAQLPDFAWWSGLTLAEVRKAVRLLGERLQREAIDDREYWFDAAAPPAAAAGDSAHLLPNFDEYTVGYRDRAAALHPDRPFDPSVFAFGSILANVAMVGGRAAGSWRRSIRGRAVELDVRPLDGLSAREREALVVEARRYARFVGQPVELTFR